MFAEGCIHMMTSGLVVECDHKVACVKLTCGYCVPMPSQCDIPPGSVSE